MSRIQDLYTRYSKLDKSEFDRNKLAEFREDLKSIKDNELNGAEEHKLFLDLLRLFRSIPQQFMEFIGTNFQKTIKDLITVGASGMYSNELHFMDELIQNVDDCEYDNPSDAKLSVKCDWNHGVMIFEYNEKGFSPYNVYAITGIAEQAKNIDPNKVQIGEKGLGFKSVFGVANTVLIQSGWFSFKLNEADFTSPIPEYDSFEFVEGTRLTLFMEPNKVHNIFTRFSGRYKSSDALLCKNPLLFLNKLSELRVYFDGFRSLKFTIERKHNVELIKGLEKAEHVKLSYEDGRDFSNEITCLHYVMPITYDREACVSRYGKDTAFPEKRMNMQVIIPDIEYVKDKNGITKGAFYSFLPTQVEIPAPIVCHIPFKLDPSREHVDSQGNNKWFVHSCKSFSKMFDAVIKDIAETYKEDVVYYLPKHYDCLFKSEKDYAIFNLPEFKGEHFLSLPIFYTEMGFVSADKIYAFAEPEKVKSVKRVGELIGEKKQLFLAPDVSKLKGLKIDTIANVTDRLFSVALTKYEHAEEIFKILEAYEGFSFDEKIKSLQGIRLNDNQVNSIFTSNKCCAAFRRRAIDCLRNAQRPKFEFDLGANKFIDVRDIDPTLNIEASDFGDTASKYFTWVKFACVLSDLIPKGEYFIFQNVLLLSKHDTLSALSLFCNHLDRKDIFAARLVLRNCSRELDLVDDSITAEEYLRKLCNVRKTLQSAFEKDVFNNYINLINQAGTKPERYINELLQNADDCEYSQGVIPTFKLEVSKDAKLIGTRYNEKGFTKSNVRAITAIGESTKKRLIAGEKDANVIGEKGVGFKAVFAVANKVSIYSGDFCFALSASEPTIPKLLAKKDKFEKGTTMLFELKEKMSLDFFSEEKVLRLCLCLRKLRNITIGEYKVVIKDEDGIRHISINDKVYEYKIISNEFIVDDEQVLNERQALQRRISKKQTIKFYVPIGSKAGTKYPNLYSGLPTEIETKIQLVIDAPFELDTSRSNVIENRWNAFVRRKLFDSLKNLIVTTCKTEGINAFKFINIKRENNTYVFDLFSNTRLNQASFLNELHSLEIIPTWSANRFVSATKANLYRIPKLLNYVLENDGDVNQELSNFVKCKENKYDAILEALGVKLLPIEKVVPLLKSCYEDFLNDETFLKYMYAYFEENLNLINGLFYVREQLKDMKIVPLKGKTNNTTEFLCLKECIGNLYVKNEAETSSDMCWILNTTLLKKELCEKIFGIDINVLTSVIEEETYRKKLKKIVENEVDIKKLYGYLIGEFTSNQYLFTQCRDYLIAHQFLVPLKNELGEIVKGNIYISKETAGYFEGHLIPSHISHRECMALARFIRCDDIANVHYDELNPSRQLTADDIESLQDEGILNGFEILNCCKRDGLIAQDLILKYQLDVFSPISVEFDESVFNQPINDKYRFYEKMKARLANPIRIVPKVVERTIHIGVTSKGDEISIENSNRHDYVVRKYTTEPGYCACQMCKTAKKLSYIEVNNIEKSPKFYWEECGVVLCLECSKHFEELREKVDVRERFYREIKKANVLVDEPIEIPIAADLITFSQSHLAEIQEILKKQDEMN